MGPISYLDVSLASKSRNLAQIAKIKHFCVRAWIANRDLVSNILEIAWLLHVARLNAFDISRPQKLGSDSDVDMEKGHMCFDVTMWWRDLSSGLAFPGTKALCTYCAHQILGAVLGPCPYLRTLLAPWKCNYTLCIRQYNTLKTWQQMTDDEGFRCTSPT